MRMHRSIFRELNNVVVQCRMEIYHPLIIIPGKFTTQTKGAYSV